MKRDEHEEARELIALGQDLADAQSVWLQSHLDECQACARYTEKVRDMVRTLRSLPLAADSRLVRATQRRVRFHAGRLRETRERIWVVWTACLGVGLSTTLTAPLLWRLFRWMGEWIGVSTLVWQAGFIIIFFFTPALVVIAILLGRGTHVTKSEEEQWR